ncbi:MAG: hypothetical protein IJL66_05440 [Lachnospiraceae bacterium]|nr:hypothetical protein [Lachnospiraceae bacterium]
MTIQGAQATDMRQPITVEPLSTDKWLHGPSTAPSLGEPSEPTDSSEVNYDHRIAFASDLRGDTAAIEAALKGYPKDPEYVSFLGDMVGDGPGDAPAYDAAEDVYQYVHDLYEDVLIRYFSILWANHDANVSDPAGLIRCPEDELSEEIFRGVNSDGSVAYYVYGIDFYDMTNALNAYEATIIFKHWVKGQDPTIPVYVVSHVPVQALRGDNPGACYWNEALNFAATGVEGLIGEGTQASVIRNVFFLSGHNVTADPTEYAFAPGSKMRVQIDTTEGSQYYTAEQFEAQGVKVTEEEREDSEAEGGKVTARSIVSDVYYTSVTAGYLKANQTSLYIHQDEKEITLTKYHEGKTVSLGKDIDGKSLPSSLTLEKVREDDEDGPAIKTQPQDAIVTYPAGTTFTVEMEHPEDIASYQWILVDKEGAKYPMRGVSGNQPTLIVPSSQRSLTEITFYCLITDKNGKRSITRRAALDMENASISKPVFYVGEYPIEPGQTLDLATVDLGDGTPLGSGTVAFDANAKDLTITNLLFNNSKTTADLVMAPNVGLDMEFMNPDQLEYNITFVGDNRIINTYYDHNYNMGGIPFDFYFNGELGERPLVNFIGDGTLRITNGTIGLRVLGDMMLDIDVTIEQDRPEYADGFAADNILVANGRKIDVAVNGSAFSTSNNLFMENADVTVKANIPHISVGAVSKKIFNCGGTINLVRTNLTADVTADQELCGETGGNAIISADGEFFISDGSNVDLKLTAKGDPFFASSCGGVTVRDLYLKNSKLKIDLDSDVIFTSMGIYTEEAMDVTGSTLDVSVKTNGTVYGITAETGLRIEDSDVTISALNYGDYPVYQDIAAACDEAVIRLYDPKYEIRLVTDASDAGPGIALACDLGLQPEDQMIPYEADYKPERIDLGTGVVAIEPEGAVISRSAVVLTNGMEAQFVPVEAFYDPKDTSITAMTVTLRNVPAPESSAPESTEPESTAPTVTQNPDKQNGKPFPTVPVIIGLAVLIAAFAGWRAWKKNRVGRGE